MNENKRSEQAKTKSVSINKIKPSKGKLMKIRTPDSYSKFLNGGAKSFKSYGQASNKSLAKETKKLK